MATGAAIGAVGGAVSHKITTGSWEGAGKSALDSGSNGALGGAIGGTVTGALSSTLKVATAAKYWDQGSFSSSIKSMDYHYKKHILEEGGLAKNIFGYTDDALNFANRNQNLLKFTNNYNYSNQSWNYSYIRGFGGEFTGNGNIITFWYK